MTRSISWTELERKIGVCLSASNFSVIARPVRTLVVAIPRLEGKCIDNCPTERGNVAISGGNRYLVPFNRGIATPVCALVRNDSKYSTNTNLYAQLEFEKGRAARNFAVRPIWYDYFSGGRKFSKMGIQPSLAASSNSWGVRMVQLTPWMPQRRRQRKLLSVFRAW